jgi:predicted transcriptional regulator
MAKISEFPALGDLEVAVMEQLWGAGPADVKQVHAVLARKRRITLNTVQSAMERLYRKGLLGREKVSHAYVYAARRSQKEVTRDIVGHVVARLAGGTPEPMLSAFVDLAARDGDETLTRLEHLIAEKRKGVKGR